MNAPFSAVFRTLNGTAASLSALHETLSRMEAETRTALRLIDQNRERRVGTHGCRLAFTGLDHAVKVRHLHRHVVDDRELDLDMTGTCTGSMLVQHMAGSGVAQDAAVSTPSFFDMNVRLSYDLRIYKEITLQLYGGVQNLFNAYQKDFDKGADRDSGYIYGPSLPRSWFVGAKFSF